MRYGVKVSKAIIERMLESGNHISEMVVSDGLPVGAKLVSIKIDDPVIIMTFDWDNGFSGLQEITPTFTKYEAGQLLEAKISPVDGEREYYLSLVDRLTGIIERLLKILKPEDGEHVATGETA